MPRSKIVDLDITRYYHCFSRCVRRAFLCGEGYEHRKQWLEDRVELLSQQFAVSIAGFSVMDNHFHVLVRLDPIRAESWTDEEVVRRWIAVYPPRGIDFDDESNVQMWVDHYSQNKKKIAVYRERLADLGWFMKALKEPLARLANREDNCKGAFWEGRYQSIGILDDEGLLGTCVYIDLNPVAAGTAATPEASKHTSIRQRIIHCRKKGRLNTLQSAKQGSIAASRKIGNAEQDHWLLPFEDRRPHTHAKPASSREGMIEKFTLGNYLMLVEYTGRLFRQGKARINDGVKHIFDRLQTSVAFWTDKVRKMLSSKQLRGRCFAGSSQGIPPSIQKKSSVRMINLSPQAAST